MGCLARSQSAGATTPVGGSGLLAPPSTGRASCHTQPHPLPGLAQLPWHPQPASVGDPFLHAHFGLVSRSQTPLLQILLETECDDLHSSRIVVRYPYLAMRIKSHRIASVIYRNYSPILHR